MLSATALQPLFTLHLQPAQRAWEFVPRGAAITVSEGTVRLHLRACLAGMWVELPVLLHAGHRHRMEVAGWIQMEAVSAAQVNGVARPGWEAVFLRLFSYFDSALRGCYMR